MKYRNFIPLIAMLVSACEQPDVPAPESEVIAPIEQPTPAMQPPTASETPVAAPRSAADAVIGTTPIMPQDNVNPNQPVEATMEAVPEESAPEGLMQDYVPLPEDAAIIDEGEGEGEGEGMPMEELDVSEEYVEEPDYSTDAPMDDTGIMVEDVLNSEDLPEDLPPPLNGEIPEQDGNEIPPE